MALAHVNISGATTLDASHIGKLIICSGAAAYTVKMPTAAQMGASDSIIGFKYSSALTNLVTRQRADGSAYTIDGATNHMRWAGEEEKLYWDGSNFHIIDAKLRAMTCTIRRTANEAGITSGAFHTISLDGTDIDNTGLMADLVNNRIVIKRTGVYLPNAQVHQVLAAAATVAQSFLQVNSAAIAESLLHAHGAETTGGPLACGPVSLVAGDVLILVGYQNSASNSQYFGQATGNWACTLGVTEIV